MQIIGCSKAKLLAEKISRLKSYNLIETQSIIFSLKECCVRVNDVLDPTKAVYIVQSFSDSVNDSLIELLLTINAVKEQGVSDIRIIFPYMAYSRQNRALYPGSAVGISVIAKLLEPYAITSVITLDLHDPKSVELFPYLCLNIEVSEFFANFLQQELKLDLASLIIVAPDKGSQLRAKEMSERLSVPYLVMDKKRTEQEMNICITSGEIEGKTCVIVDDIIDSGATLSLAVKHLVSMSVLSIYVCCTHIVSFPKLTYLLDNLPIKAIIVADYGLDQSNKHPKFMTKDVAGLIASYLN